MAEMKRAGAVGKPGCCREPRCPTWPPGRRGTGKEPCEQPRAPSTRNSTRSRPTRPVSRHHHKIPAVFLSRSKLISPDEDLSQRPEGSPQPGPLSAQHLGALRPQTQSTAEMSRTGNPEPKLRDITRIKHVFH